MVLQSSPLVSIGIPTYNRPKGIQETLSSITRQTYSNIEIIISDNCSPTSETEDVVREFMKKDSRIRYFRQEKNLGLFYNFKFVFDVSKGDYFTWAADDDTRDKKYIEKCLDIFQQESQSKDLLLVNSYSQLVEPDSGKVLKTDKGCTTIELNPTARYHKYLSSIYTDQAGIGDLIYGVIKRKPLQDVMETQANIIEWDHTFLASLALKGGFYTIPEPLMSSAPGGISTAKDVYKMAKVQLIDNPFHIKKARWVRVLSLCNIALKSNKIPIWSKLSLSNWIIWNRIRKTLVEKLQSS